MPSEHICGEYGAPDRPNTALEATGHSTLYGRRGSVPCGPRLGLGVRRLTLKCGTQACLSSRRNTPHMHFLSREDNAKWGRIIKEAGIKGD